MAVIIDCCGLCQCVVIVGKMRDLWCCACHDHDDIHKIINHLITDDWLLLLLFVCGMLCGDLILYILSGWIGIESRLTSVRALSSHQHYCKQNINLSGFDWCELKGAFFNASSGIDRRASCDIVAFTLVINFCPPTLADEQWVWMHQTHGIQGTDSIGVILYLVNKYCCCKLVVDLYVGVP